MKKKLRVESGKLKDKLHIFLSYSLLKKFSTFNSSRLYRDPVWKLRSGQLSTLKGFTLIELILTITIIITLGTISALFYTRFLTQNNVASVQDQLFGALRKAHTYAMVSRNSNTSGWGVHYDSTAKKVTLFQGASYAARNTLLDETFSLANSVTVTGFTDVIFARGTGIPTVTGGGATPTPTPTTAPSPGNWYNPAWAYRKMITIDETKVQGSNDLINFPVLINLSSDSDLAAGAQDSGNDILFTASDGTTKLDHEIESFNGISGSFIAWVRIPTLLGATNTDIYMYYGNAGASNQQNIAGVWDSNYRAVWHLKESPNGAVGQIKDSTVNANHATSQSGMSAANQVSGKIGGSFLFDGTDDYLNVPYNASLGITGDITISAWVMRNSINQYGVILAKANGITQWDYDFYICSATCGSGSTSNNKPEFYSEITSPQWVTSSGMIADTTSWHHVAVRRNGSTMVFYIDGSAAGNFTLAGSFANNPLNVWIGKEGTGTSINGLLDEIHLSGSNRTASWITTEYNNQNSPDTFYSVGPETAQSSPTPTQAGSVSTFFPVADTVLGSDFPSDANGDWDELASDFTDGTPGNATYVSYLKYDLSSLSGATITNAMLQMTTTVDGSPATHNIHQVNNTTWSENTLTYNTRPAMGAVITTINGFPADTTRQFDVTSFISTKAGQSLTLGIDTASTDAIWFYSKEDTGGRSTRLIVTHTGGSGSGSSATITITGNNGTTRQITVNSQGVASRN